MANNYATGFSPPWEKKMTAVNSTTIPCEPHRLPIDLCTNYIVFTRF